MCSTLSGWPAQLKHVETSLIANLGPDAVSALGHGVTVESQLVIIFDKDVQGPVLAPAPSRLECLMPRETFPPMLPDFLAAFSRGKLSFLSLRSLLPLEVARRFKEEVEEVEGVGIEESAV